MLLTSVAWSLSQLLWVTVGYTLPVHIEINKYNTPQLRGKKKPTEKIVICSNYLYIVQVKSLFFFNLF